MRKLTRRNFLRGASGAALSLPWLESIAATVPATVPLSRSPEDVPALAALVVGTEEGGVAFLPDGSPVLNQAGARLDTTIDAAVLRRIGREADMPIIRAATGDSDLRRLMGAIESNLQQADDPDARWRDQGWWALWPAAFLLLLWFRRGWTMRW